MITITPESLVQVAEKAQELIETGVLPETSVEEKILVSWMLIEDSIKNYKTKKFNMARYESTLAIDIVTFLITKHEYLEKLKLIITDFLDYIRKSDYNHWEFLLSKVPNYIASYQIKKAKREKFIFDAILGILTGLVLGIIYIVINIVR
jgi:hypothetical protein